MSRRERTDEIILLAHVVGGRAMRETRDALDRVTKVGLRRMWRE